VAKGEGPFEVFAPMPTTDSNQRVVSKKITLSDQSLLKKASERMDATYGNGFWHLGADHTNGKPLKVTMTYVVERNRNSPSLKSARATFLTSKEAKEMELWLKPNKLVPISGDLIDNIRSNFKKVPKEPLPRSKAIYDYVVDNMEYKKVGKGWGNGDTYWACSAKYGNCTDFHALFNSLARAEGIPSKFEIGFPIPEDKPEGKIGGYHCWVNFYLPNVGWVPIDASEAKKHPKKRDMFFGTHPADRIMFSRGRDLVLGQKSKPLNYFVFPLVEVGGKPLPKVETQFSYRNMSAAH
jgi:transglutaminase-like putative cysteine protease